MKAAPEYVARALAPSDLGLVHSSWGRGAREVAPACYVPSGLYWPAQRAHVEACLERCGARVLVHPDAPAEVIAYACSERRAGLLVLHWLYVYRLWRGVGVGQALLDELSHARRDALVVTQWTKHAAWLRGRCSRLVFDPSVRATAELVA